MKIVVIGGSGFLGSHVSDKLSSFGHDVHIFDNQKSKWLNSDQKYINGDILNEKLLDEALKDCDYVFNFAGLSDLDDGINQAHKTVKLNIEGNVKVLDSCCKNKVKRYFYASTVYVYSNEGGFYRCSKQASELYIEEYQKVFNLNYTILRFGSFYMDLDLIKEMVYGEL